MAIRITDDSMTLEVGGRVVATAQFSERCGRRQRRVDRFDSPGPAVLIHHLYGRDLSAG